MAVYNGNCLIWNTPASTSSTSRDGVQVESPRAGGLYFMSGSSIPAARSVDVTAKARLTSWLIDQHRLGVDCPEITSTVLDEMRQRRPLSVQERANRLLTFAHDETPIIGRSFSFSLRHLDKEMNSWIESPRFSQMKAWSESVESHPALSVDENEVMYLLDFLSNQGLLERRVSIIGANHQGPHADKDNYFEYVITPNGHSRVAEFQAGVVSSTQAFVAMWFDASLNDIYEIAIEPGIRDAGYEPLRIDRKEHNNKIDDEIIAEIRRSRFIVADFTHGDQGMRGGVYYEAGFARGLGLEVISTCRQDLLDQNKIHFDTRQYPHLGWTKEQLDSLRKALSNRISATIGDGPLKEKHN